MKLWRLTQPTMKMISNGEEKLMKKSERIQYPNNVTFKNICVFIFMPTLVYQAHPRTERIRKYIETFW